MILEIEGRPLNLNAERKMEVRQRSRAKRKIREDATWLWQSQKSKAPLVFPWRVIATPFYRTRAGCPDTGACYPTVKSVIDGAVDAGILPDDSPEYVGSILFNAPVMGTGGPDKLVLEIR